MPITNTIRGFRAKSLILIFVFFTLHSITGCVQKNDLEKVQDYVQESEVYYQRAISLYKELITKGKDLDRLYLELGKLYYNHGNFKQAVEELKGSSGNSQAKKLLGISYYRLGNFSDALEVFNKQENIDDEALYFQGLTCEKLNLFDQALELYKKIKDEGLLTKAKEQVNSIEKQASETSIDDEDAQVASILRNSPSPKKYPQAGALILLSDEKVEVTSLNTQVSQMHYIIKILNERGKEDFSETHVDYDSTYEKVELEYARTIKPDGTVADVGSRHIRDVSKYLNFPLYSNARVFIISFPEIMEGAVIDYKLKIYRNQLLNKKDFILTFPLQASEPIITANFTLTFPKDRQLHTRIINEKYNNFAANLIPHKEEKDSYLIYRWQFKDIPQIIPESNMPPQVEINPTLLISTFQSWQDIYNWWWALSKDKIRADSAIQLKVKELIKDKASEEEKVRAIHNFCAQKIRYVAVEYGQAGYEPHRAEDVYKNKYGDCKDQAILLVTMLKEAGFLAWPVLIATKDYYNLEDNFPAILFNHAIACVYLKDEYIFLDPTAETCSFRDLPPDDQARRVLIFKENGFKIQDTPLYPAEHNHLKQYLKLKVNSNETITAKKTILTFGFYDQAQRYWLLYSQPELIQQSLTERIQSISIGARLDGYEITNLDNLNSPVVLSYDFYGPEYFTAAGSLRIMPQLTNIDISLVAKDKRLYPLDFDVLETKETIFEIEIPRNFVIKYMPGSLVEDSPWLKFSVEYNFTDNRLYFKQETKLKKTEVSEVQYADFKSFFERAAKRIKERIVLERIR